MDTWGFLTLCGVTLDQGVMEMMQVVQNVGSRMCKGLGVHTELQVCGFKNI